MTDVDRPIAESLGRLYPVPAVRSDWEDVLARARRARMWRLRRPVTVRHKLVVAFALAVAISAAVLGSGLLRSSPSVLERAQAALDPNGRILHVVDRWGDGSEATYSESWQLPDGSVDHVVRRSASGAIANDCVFTDAETRCWNATGRVVDVYRHPPPEPGLPQLPYVRYASDWPASLRLALAGGFARMLGPTTFAGKPVYAVLLAASDHEGQPEFRDGVSDTLYLDRDTYLPVAERMPAGSWTRYFNTFEFLPETAENRKAAQLPAPADAPLVAHPNEHWPPEHKGS